MRESKRVGTRASWDGVLGMNARNALIREVNPTEAVMLVNQKYQTKQALEAHGIPVSPTIGVAATGQELSAITAELPDRWAIKPNRGLAGGGILLATGRSGKVWTTPSGRRISRSDVRSHGHEILSGEHSMGDFEDLLLVEPLLRPHQLLSSVTQAGLPDLRVIACHGKALAAMLRLPTSASNGKANLHQNGIGVGIHLVTGRTTFAVQGRRRITHHPDTGTSLSVSIPEWALILDMAERSGSAVGLGYYGADIVLEATLGPVIIEVNAHPGLEIQNIARTGLRAALLASSTSGPFDRQ